VRQAAPSGGLVLGGMGNSRFRVSPVAKSYANDYFVFYMAHLHRRELRGDNVALYSGYGPERNIFQNYARKISSRVLLRPSQ
jgi:hypothetical protein